MNEDDFLDYYEVLQVNSNAELYIINRIFKYLAQEYHPDNVNTGDEEKFRLLVKAHEVLRDPVKRAHYDAKYQQAKRIAFQSTLSGTDDDNIEDDFTIQSEILKALYLNRRQNISNFGLGNLQLCASLGISRETLEFHIWYLREKQWITRTDSGLLSITASGVDHLQESSLRVSALRKLTFQPEPSEINL